MKPSSFLSSTTFFTVLGFVALLFWSIDPSLMVELKRLPLFETLTILFTCVFLLTCTKLLIYRQWDRLKQPIMVWIIGVLGIGGNNICYLFALKHGPPGQIVLIYYLWPIVAMLLAVLFLNSPFSKRNLLAVLLGLTALFVLNFNGSTFTLQSKFLTSYIAAIFVALFWSIYIVYTRKKSYPIELVGLFFGLSACITLPLHLIYEQTVVPNFFELQILIVIALLTQGLAYFCWQLGINKGQLKLLNCFAYINPILAVTWLFLLGKAHFTWRVAIAYLLVVASALLIRKAKQTPTKD